MNNKTFNNIQDLLLLALAIPFIYYAIQHYTKFNAKQYRDKVVAEPFTAHEVDPSIVQKITAAQKKVDTALDLAHKNSSDLTTINRLREIENQLTDIHQKYTHTSPAIALLGPIGTTSVVLKEAELEKKIEKLSDELNTIINTIHTTNIP